MIPEAKNAAVAALIILVAMFGQSINSRSDYLALAGGTIYVSPTEEPIPDGVVLINDGKIAAVGTRGQVKIPQSAQLVDCTGRTITAGFWNSHVHFMERKWADVAAIPTGEIATVEGTPFDFRVGTKIGERIHAENDQLTYGRGYDHNWVVRGKAGELRPAARVYAPKSGRVLSVETTEPAIQFYSGNFLDGTLVGKSGVAYVQRSGLCLETQAFPDAPNHGGFPSTELKVGEVYSSVTTWAFGVE